MANDRTAYLREYRKRPGVREKKNAARRKRYATYKEAEKAAHYEYMQQPAAKLAAAERERQRRAKIKADPARWAAVRERRQSRDRARYRDDPEFRAVRNSESKNWRNKNRARFDSLLRKRRYKMAGSSGQVTAEEWRAILEYFDHRCAYCLQRKKLEQEHVVAISRGGTNTADNVVPACRACNGRKHNKPVWAMLRD